MHKTSAQKQALRTTIKSERSTRVRRALIGIFEKTQQPLSVPELLEQLEKYDINANKTTVYRQLAALQKKDILKEIPIAGHALHYELAKGQAHHHHLICVNCHRKQNISITEDVARHERTIKKKHSFAVTHHSLEFYGYCKQCQ